MKVSQLILGSLLLFFSALGLYTSLTAQPKSWSDWFAFGSSLFLLFLAIVYLGTNLKEKTTNKKGNILDFLQTDVSGILRRLKGKKGKTPYLKGNILYVDVVGQKLFRFKVAFGAVLLTLLGLALFKSFDDAFLSLLLSPFILAGIIIYAELVPTPGIYKNGKYLGEVPAAFIKVGDGIALGKRQDTETVGSLEILRDGGLVAELHLTAEGFMELRPEKISEVFPEVKGKIEKFKNLFKVGDYTLKYSFFTKSYGYKGSYGYQSHSSDDDTVHTNRRNDYITNPAYSSLPGNVWHNILHH